MVRAITRVSELVGSNPAAVASLSASTDNARPLFDLVREARRTSEAADRDRRHDLRPGDRRARVGGCAFRYSERADLGAVDALRHAVAARPAPRPPAADRQRRRGAARRRGDRARPLSRAGSDDAHADRLHARKPISRPPICERGSKAPAICRDRARWCCRAPSGEPLAEAWVDPGALAAARARWRRTYFATVIAAAGVTVLLFIGPLLDRRIGATKRALPDVPRWPRARSPARGGLLLWTAFAVAARGSSATPVTLLIAGGHRRGPGQPPGRTRLAPARRAAATIRC